MLKGRKKPPPEKLGKPRTVRLHKEDERWVDAQPHVEGFSGVLREAVKFYKKYLVEQNDQQRKTLLESVR